MTKFDELNVEYRKWRDSYFEDINAARAFAHELAAKFRGYIGAPERLDLTRIGNSDAVPKYVWACQATLDESGDNFTAHLNSSPLDVLTRVGDEWLFALMVRFEMAENSWPKEAFPIAILFKREGHEYACHLSFETDAIYIIKKGSEDNYQPFFDKIIDGLKRGLRRESVDGGRSPYGFVAFDRIPGSS